MQDVPRVRRIHHRLIVTAPSEDVPQLSDELKCQICDCILRVAWVENRLWRLTPQEGQDKIKRADLRANLAWLLDQPLSEPVGRVLAELREAYDAFIDARHTLVHGELMNISTVSSTVPRNAPAEHEVGVPRMARREHIVELSGDRIGEIARQSEKLMQITKQLEDVVQLEHHKRNQPQEENQL